MVAVDLGAESGRAVVGTFDGGRLALEDVHRFPNVPVTVAGTLHWDFLRLFGEVTAGLRRAAAGGPVASVGVDAWGVDFGLLDARGRLLANPVHYRDRAHRGDAWTWPLPWCPATRSTRRRASSSCPSTRCTSSTRWSAPATRCWARPTGC